MTDEQKKQIRDLQSQGYGYRKIAAILGLSPYTVKYYYRQINSAENNTPVVYKIPNGETCPVCNKILVHVPGRRKKKFCSDECRMKWWTKHQDCIKHTNVHDIECQHCGKSFSVYGNSNRKYCSHDCYIKERFGGQYAG